jgi:ligand-binding SRPBCC domain-containing protein
MSRITLHTEIKAPAERCFDLSLSVDIHVASTAKTGERAIAGVTSGLMKYGDTVTWRAKHLGRVQDLTSRISYYDRPRMFVSQMVRGAFKKLYHEHIFESRGPVTTMIDKFDFEAPFGVFGKLASSLFLKRYMQTFLEERNATIKSIAESDEWRKYLPDDL